MYSQIRSNKIPSSSSQNQSQSRGRQPTSNSSRLDVLNSPERLFNPLSNPKEQSTLLEYSNASSNPSARMSHSPIGKSSPLSLQNSVCYIPTQNEILLEKSLDITVKIKATEDSHPITITLINPKQYSQKQILMRFTTEDDLFFLYSYIIDKSTLRSINEEFDLKLYHLQEFLVLFNDLLKEVEEGTKFAVLKFPDSGTLMLEIFNMVNQKEFLILRLQAQKDSFEVAQEWVAFKYGQMRQEIRDEEKKIAQLTQLVKVKNPYLLTFFNKIG